MRTLNVGVVGCGWNSDNHLRVYSNLANVRLVAVCDTDSTRATDKARRYNAEQVFTNYDSLLALDLDLIDIVTPTISHAELATLALESGHNVLVEKPMALTSRESLGMINAARKSGQTLCVTHNKRFLDSVMKTKAIIDREGLRVSRMSLSQFSAHNLPKPSWVLREETGGILWESVVHQIYLLEHFLGRIESVYATAERIKPPVHDSFTLVLQGESAVGVSEYNCDVNEPLFEFQLVTREGDRFEGDLVHDFFLRRSSKSENREALALKSFSDDFYKPFAKWTGHLRDIVKMQSYQSAMPLAKTFYVLIGRLLSFLAEESSNLPVSAEEGLSSIRILEAAKRAILTRKPENVE